MMMLAERINQLGGNPDLNPNISKQEQPLIMALARLKNND